MATIQGIITDSQNKVFPAATVLIYQSWPSPRTLHGRVKTSRSGAYSLTFTPRTLPFSTSKGRPKLMIEVYDIAGKLLKKSAQVDLIGNSLSLNLKLDAAPEVQVRFTILREAIREVMNGLEEDNLSEEDLPNLQEDLQGDLTAAELADLPNILKAFQESARTNLPAEIFFALPTHTTLPALMAMEDANIRMNHGQGVQNNRIPELNIDTLLGQIEAIRHAEGYYNESGYSGRLLNAGTGKPIAGLRVEICKNNNIKLGEDYSNESGLFGVLLRLQPSETAARQLKVFRDNRLLLTQNLTVTGALADISIVLPPAEDTSITVDAWAQSAGVVLPAALKQYLTAKNVATLRDLRQRGQLSDGVPGVEANLVKRIDAHATLNLLSGTTPDMAEKLHAKGFSNPEAIAKVNRRQFIRTMGGTAGIGDNQAGMVWTQAAETVALTDTMVSNLMFNPSSPQTPSDEGDFGLLTDILPEPCTRENCADALSRAAYLADLLDFALNAIEINNQPLTFAVLEQMLFQPYQTLPIACEGDEGTVPKMQLCIEVLRNFLKAQPPAVADAALLTQQERQCRTSVYTTLLEKIGVSFSEIRNANAAENNAMAQRLGIPSTALSKLLLDPQTFTEADLERIFGWRDTRRAPLTEPTAVPEFLVARRDFLQSTWKKEDQDNQIVAIDPDLVSPGHLTDPVNGPAVALWQKRQVQLNTEYTRLKGLLQQNAGNNQAAFNALLPKNAPRAVLDEKIGASAANFLKKIEGLIQKNAIILSDEWEDIVGILVQYYKKTVLLPTWLSEETGTGLYLNPEIFQVPDVVFDLEGRQSQVSLNVWRSPASALRTMEKTIESRTEVRRNTEAQLIEAVALAEKTGLPALRTALIMASRSQGADLIAKSRWITRNLLIDCESDVLQPTTRLAQAAESLQLLITALQRGEWQQSHPGWAISLDFFEEKWKWLGSFQTWRAAMMVYLFPENLLYPGLHRRMSTALGSLIEQTRQGGGLNPTKAQQLANNFDTYYKDICNLTPEAAVVAETSLSGAGQQGVYTYVFAKGVSGKVYWSRFLFNEALDEDGQRLWEEIPLGEDTTNKVAGIIGAKAYSDKSGKQRIFLFVKTLEGSIQKLVYTTFDLKTSTWAGELTEPGSLPENTTRFDATVKMVMDPKGTQPPHLFVRLIGQKSVWDRQLNAEGADWGGEDWNLTMSASLGERFSNLLGVTETMTNDGSKKYRECYVFMQNSNGIYYRIFGNYDDGAWTKLVSGKAKWLGLCLGTQTELTNDRVYTFYRPEGQVNTICSRIRPKGKPEAKVKIIYKGKESIRFFNSNWLIPNTGLDLDKIVLAGKNESVLDILLKGEYQDQKVVLGLFNPESLGNTLGQKGQYASDLCKKTTLSKSNLYQIIELYIWGAEIVSLQRKSQATDPSHDHRLDFSSDIISLFVINRPINRIINLPNPFFFNQVYFIHTETVQHKDAVASGLFSLACNVAANGALNFSNVSDLLAPLSIDYEAVFPNVNAINLATRKQHTQTILQRHGAANPGLLHYFYEAYFAMPMQIAAQLQRQGHYRAALDTYRLVIDYTLPTQAARKVWAGLAKEESMSGGFERTVAWIKDPLNPHAIAGVRRNTYTRYSLLTVLRCLLDFANSEFGRDSAESRAQAKSLYLSALDLIDSSDLKISDAPWELALREMKRALQSKMPTGWETWINAMVVKVKALGNAAKVETTANKVKVKAETANFPALVGQIEAEIKSAGSTPATPRTLAQAMAERTAKKGKARQIMQKNLTVNVTIDRYSQQRKASEAKHLAALTGKDETLLRTTSVAMEAWYKGNGTTDGDQQNWLLQKGNLGQGFAEAPAAPYAFCIPDNPMAQALRLEALLNLYKLNNGLNIAGDERPVEIEDAALSVDDLPILGGNGSISLPSTIKYQPTPYTYFALIERARQLAGLAQQLESSLLSVLEKRDSEAFSLLRARQEFSIAQENVRTQSLRVGEADKNVRLQKLSQDRAESQTEHFKSLIDGGLSFLETAALDLMIRSLFLPESVGMDGMNFSPSGKVQTMSNIASTFANFERRKEEWKNALALANFDFNISKIQVSIAQGQVRLVNQERKISELQSTQSQQAIDFLSNKFTNADLFDWMSGILENIYAGVLSMATATARLAEQQLTFERQTQPRTFIQADYWVPARSLASGTETGQSVPDRRGMTGSTRLLFDITQLDQHAFTTDRRKLQLSKTFSLAQMAPVDFQKFRETGILPFTTLMEYFDRDFPGHYLRLIQSVQVSIVALVPPVEGVKATLRTNGISRVVSGETQFTETEIRRQPESIAFTTPTRATGLIELRPDPNKLRPFENMGVAANWALELPKAANQFDYNTIADVFLAIDYTALESQAYREQIVQRLDRNFSAERVFSFRRELSDQWYDLNHPELVQEDQQMLVRFSTTRDDFPTNLDDLEIRHLVLYFVRRNGVKEEISVRHLRLQQEAVVLGTLNQKILSKDGILSTRTGNFSAWNPILQKQPVGTWELSLENTETLRNLFKNELIEDVLFVITYEGLTPKW